MSVLDRFRLDGRTAVVTGGAGLYGRQIVTALAQAGASVHVASRNLPALEQVAADWRGRGLDVHAHRFDQGEPADADALLAEVTQQAGPGPGPVHVLVNNAVLRPMKDWSGDVEAFEQSMRVNLTGVFALTRAFGNAMAQRGEGSIINIGSIQGRVGPDNTLYEGLGMAAPPDYFVHKGGMVQLTRYAAAELGPRGVRVNLLSPGGYLNNQDPEFIRRYEARTLLGRMGDDEDLQGAVVFLASPASAYITGVDLPVDGGYTAI